MRLNLQELTSRRFCAAGGDSVAHVNLQRVKKKTTTTTHTQVRLVGCASASTSRDGVEERVSYVSFPGSDALLHNQGEFALAVARQKEGSDQGGGIDHRWGTRHRASPGQRVCQAGGQKGNLTLQATCCTHIAPSAEMHWLITEVILQALCFGEAASFVCVQTSSSS